MRFEIYAITPLYFQLHTLLLSICHLDSKFFAKLILRQDRDYSRIQPKFLASVWKLPNENKMIVNY